MTEPSVKLLSSTPDAEKLIMNIARISNPSNRDSDNKRLLYYLIKHEHWSPFEHATLTFEVTDVSVAIVTQILRHRSMCFQQYSARYAEVSDYVRIKARRQSAQNRQSSTDDLDPATVNWFDQVQKSVWEYSYSKYKEALEKGVAKEVARFLLPQNTGTTLVITGNVRSFIHYLQLRLKEDTQYEHRMVADGICKIFKELLPTIYDAAFGTTTDN